MVNTYTRLWAGSDSVNSQGRVSAGYAEEYESHMQVSCEDHQAKWLWGGGQWLSLENDKKNNKNNFCKL